MKKYVILFCLTILLVPMSVKANTQLDLKAKSAILMDYDSGEILYSKDATKKHYPASMTKMMSLLLIYEKINSRDIKYEDEVRISKEAAAMGGSQIWAYEGEALSVKDLLYASIIASANDAIYALAEYSYGSADKFVAKMNEKAKELKLSNTNFVNPTGLHDDNHYSCAKDMAIISRELIRVGSNKLLDITSKYDAYIREGDKKFWLVNTNKLLKLYEGVDGLKTGFTQQSKYCISITAKRNNLRLISVVMGEEDTKIRNREIIQMLDYGFNNYESYKLVNKNDILKTIRKDELIPSKIDIRALDDVYITKKKNEKIKISNIEETLDYDELPYTKNKQIGSAIIKYGRFKKTIRLTTNEDIKKLDLFSVLKRCFNNLV